MRAFSGQLPLGPPIKIEVNPVKTSEKGIISVKLFINWGNAATGKLAPDNTGW